MFRKANRLRVALWGGAFCAVLAMAVIPTAWAGIENPGGPDARYSPPSVSGTVIYDYPNQMIYFSGKCTGYGINISFPFNLGPVDSTLTADDLTGKVLQGAGQKLAATDCAGPSADVIISSMRGLVTWPDEGILTADVTLMYYVSK